MELITMGRNFYPGYEMPLWHNPDEQFNADMVVTNRFRIILVEEGSGILRTGRNRSIFTAPAVFCLNEQEHPILEQSMGLKAQALYFHPNIINSVFDFDNIRVEPETFSISQHQDRGWFMPFIVRNNKMNEQTNIGYSSVKRMSEILTIIGSELAEQRDDSWPCRSRSYLFEVLFMLERNYVNPVLTENIVLPETAHELDKIILYLHTNYQKKITITELTKVFGTNRTTLAEHFNKVTGVPVMSYLSKIRVDLAAMMLRDTLLNISEIMTRVGFNDATHFGRVFRKYSGCSPSEYRQRYCWMIG